MSLLERLLLAMRRHDKILMMHLRGVIAEADLTLASGKITWVLLFKGMITFELGGRGRSEDFLIMASWALESPIAFGSPVEVSANKERLLLLLLLILLILLILLVMHIISFEHCE